MTVFLLIRHGETDAVGHTLAGRLPGVGLNARGRVQAQRLAERLAGVPIDGLFSSPLERARETAAPLAGRLQLDIQLREALNEVNCGDWQGMTFQDLDGLAHWKRFNRFRSGTRVPGGELIVEVQARMVGMVEELRGRFPEAVIALVSHGDPIKTVIAHYAGIPLDFMFRFEIEPASVSVLAVEDWGPKILCLNHTGELPALSP